MTFNAVKGSFLTLNVRIGPLIFGAAGFC